VGIVSGVEAIETVVLVWLEDTPPLTTKRTVSLECDGSLVAGDEELALREFAVGVLKPVKYRFANGSK